MTKRAWHTGPPPHIGWWEASAVRAKNKWRWWNGEYWSLYCVAEDDLDAVAKFSEQKSFLMSHEIYWTDYWPENARVPRMKP